MVVDTSALIAIARREPAAQACLEALTAAEAAIMSAGSLAECRVVAARKGVAASIAALLAAGGIEIIPVDSETTLAVENAYTRWGKGIHPARLNIFDCFAYALAKERDLPLLYVGDDFPQTDVRSAM